MSEVSDVPLTVRPCRLLCAWRPARHALSTEVRGPLPLFRCRGCGSEWVRSEAWAPVDANGARHPALVDEIERRDAGADVEWDVDRSRTAQAG